MKIPILSLLLIISLSTSAQITTDGSLGPQLNLPGPDYQNRLDAYNPSKSLLTVVPSRYGFKKEGGENLNGILLCFL